MTRVETPSSLVRKRLERLSVVDAEWQFGPMRCWEPFYDDDGNEGAYYLPICADARGVGLGSPDLVPMPVDAGTCARFLLETCEEAGCRPARWTITEPRLARELKAWLPADTRIRVRPAPEAWCRIVDVMSALGGIGPMGIFEDTDVRPQDMLKFCNAAAAFYRRRPWKELREDVPLLIDPVQGEGLPRVVLLISEKDNQGLLGFDSAHDLIDASRGRESPSSGWWLGFMPRQELPWQDRQDFEQHNWPVAFKKAHPLLVRLEGGFPYRHANREELHFFSLLLLGIAQARPQLAEGAPVEMNFKFTDGSGEVRFWIVPLTEQMEDMLLGDDAPAAPDEGDPPIILRPR